MFFGRAREFGSVGGMKSCDVHDKTFRGQGSDGWQAASVIGRGKRHASDRLEIEWF
jgi:hypothetical protein